MVPICFVIQPFDSGKFDKRFDDVFCPAIKAAGLEAYRVDRDLTVEVPIDSIEEGIRNAAICLADITTDNPNVWYELGYAFASGRPVIMVCSNERIVRKYPFDIQHRTIINYSTDAPRDFESLRTAITERIGAQLNKAEVIRQMEEAEQVAPSQGLSQQELIVLAILAGDTGVPGTISSIYSLKFDAERSGLTSIGFALGFRRLVAKELIRAVEGFDERDGPYDAARLTTRGWEWVESHESLFLLHRATPQVRDDDIPF